MDIEVINEYRAGVAGALCCCICGAAELDRSDAEGNFVRDDDAVKVVEDNDNYEPDNPTETRGGYIEIGLQCWRGHLQRLIIANHKGAEIIGIFPVEK